MDILLTLWNNILAYIFSLPTNVLIVMVVMLCYRLITGTIKQGIKIALIYFGATFLLGMFGINLPTIPQIIEFLLKMIGI